MCNEIYEGVLWHGRGGGMIIIVQAGHFIFFRVSSQHHSAWRGPEKGAHPAEHKTKKLVGLSSFGLAIPLAISSTLYRL